MAKTFDIYSQAILDAFLKNSKNQDTIHKKQEILDSIGVHARGLPTSVLFVGFGPWILANKIPKVYVTDISQETKNYLDTAGIKYTYIDIEELGQYTKNFDWVVAADEYFTFAQSEEEQRTKILLLAGVARDMIVTTLKDYKNQDFKDREFSVPLAVRNDDSVTLFVEYNNYDFRDKNSWSSSVYEIQGQDLKVYGPFDRCTMYFKQMAKFSLDAGASEFFVHKNLMYKSLIKKNYEHVISISFKKTYGNQ